MREKKTTWFKFWLTPQDKRLLKEEARLSNVSIAEFLRSCIRYFSSDENRSILFASRDARKVLNNVKYELNRYGNNLNQIALKLNRNRYGFTNNEISSMNNELKEIKTGIVEIKAKIDGLEGEMKVE